jgi:hypothetical protein
LRLIVKIANNISFFLPFGEIRRGFISMLLPAL